MTTQQVYTSLINGTAGADIAAADRGLLYGDGFFTTVRVVQGQPDLWPLHVERLQTCARAVFGWAALPKSVLTLIEQELSTVTEGHQECGARITLTRGVGGRGYAPPESNADTVTRMVTAFAYPAVYSDWQRHGVKTELAAFYLGSQHPRLAGLKTLNRLEQVMLKQELAQRDTDELIVLDASGAIAEATAGNVFWRQGDTWYTPELAQTGVHGVVRQALLTKYPQIQRVNAQVNALRTADEAFVCNALMGQVSIRSLDGKALPTVRNYKNEAPFTLAGLSPC
ncbi:aminodeoxychorismate lyase [Aliidiomarina taiwanensis]|uniref:Aminodeoxychorismate lyase n=1 Tax=Aliidiomarina taiwanensis TaxID=946228 RepID=A0A432X9Q4_9GAMM|nr:aminodeoxychorismate lyase [Aliidiomarina taiwanensis]RUO44054.1 aminodeoxychorismate lyase [Aliidiomarina taiwanensis]